MTALTYQYIVDTFKEASESSADRSPERDPPPLSTYLSTENLIMSKTTTDLLHVRDAAERRRSVRAYEPVPVPREDLEDILDVVRRAPSAFNVQPWRFVVVETPEVKERLAAAAYQQRQIGSAPAVIVLYTDVADALEHVDEVLHPGMDAAQRTGARQAILRSLGSRPEAEREQWGAEQGNIALGYLLLAAEAHGYQTSPMLGLRPLGGEVASRPARARADPGAGGDRPGRGARLRAPSPSPGAHRPRGVSRPPLAMLESLERRLEPGDRTARETVAREQSADGGAPADEACANGACGL